MSHSLLLAVLSLLTPRADLPPRGYSIPLLDLAFDKSRQTIVDREAGQYLGHPTTVLLEDGKTVIAVYPKGHGKGPIVMKRSSDGGLTWSDRLPTPDNWSTSLETPTIHRMIDKDGKKRLILFSGLYPIRLSHSEDDGATWTPLAPIGDFGGIVAMGSVERLKNGDYMALFHDDGRYFRVSGKAGTFVVYKTLSADGGLTWSEPTAIASLPDAQLCEPGLVRSPDGKQLAVLLRENTRKNNSYVIFSDDEGATWTAPRELPGALTGDRHTAKYAPDGRLFISFRDTTHQSPTRGDWVGWVGTYDDIVSGREGEYRVRLMDNTKALDCAYPGVEILSDGTFVTTTYGHWTEGQAPYIVAVRFKLDELDRLAAEAGQEGVGKVAPVEVRDDASLRSAIRSAGPGTTLRLAPGTYSGGLSAANLQGTIEQPITIEAADPTDPPVIEGGASGLHLSDPAHITLRHLTFQGATGNGLNIDDAGTPDTPAHHVLLDSIVVRDIGPRGNSDGIKLSGVEDFRVSSCTVERWGDGGSAIDMVGCHRGEIAGSTFRHDAPAQANGVQAKGGTVSVTIRGCRFIHPGALGVNIGGSTGPPYFRPVGTTFEARCIVVEDCIFLGGDAAIAFAGSEASVARHNTIYHPRRWAFRILQENRSEGMIPCRTGRISHNLVVYRSEELRTAINVGDGTEPSTFQLDHNHWYCDDEPSRKRPDLPIAEEAGIYGNDPRLESPSEGTIRFLPGAPPLAAGARIAL
jgi:hypothetical protein